MSFNKQGREEGEAVAPAVGKGEPGRCVTNPHRGLVPQGQALGPRIHSTPPPVPTGMRARASPPTRRQYTSGRENHSESSLPASAHRVHLTLPGSPPSS